MKNHRDIVDQAVSEIRGQLTVLGHSEKVAEGVAQRLDRALREEWGGEEHYVYVFSKSKRNEAIYAAWRSGDDKAYLAKKYGVSVATIERAIRRFSHNKTAGHDRSGGRS